MAGSGLGGSDISELVGHELVHRVGEGKVVECPVVVLGVRPGDGCVWSDVTVSDVEHELLSAESTVNNHTETRFEGDLGRMSGTVSGGVTSVSKIVVLLGSHARSVRAVELAVDDVSELGGVVEWVFGVETHVHHVDSLEVRPSAWDCEKTPDDLGTGRSGREGSVVWITTKDGSVGLGESHGGNWILKTPVGLEVLALLDFGKCVESEDTESVTDVEDSNLLLLDEVW